MPRGMPWSTRVHFPGSAESPRPVESSMYSLGTLHPSMVVAGQWFQNMCCVKTLEVDRNRMMIHANEPMSHGKKNNNQVGTLQLWTTLSTFLSRKSWTQHGKAFGCGTRWTMCLQSTEQGEPALVPKEQFGWQDLTSFYGVEIEGRYKIFI